MIKLLQKLFLSVPNEHVYPVHKGCRGCLYSCTTLSRKMSGQINPPAIRSWSTMSTNTSHTCEGNFTESAMSQSQQCHAFNPETEAVILEILSSVPLVFLEVHVINEIVAYQAYFIHLPRCHSPRGPIGCTLERDSIVVMLP